MLNSALVFGVVAPWVTNTLTPIWLLGVGAAAGLFLLLAIWLVLTILSFVPGLNNLRFCSRRTVSEIPLAVREGALWGVFLITCGMAVFGVAGSLLIRDRDEILKSLPRLLTAGNVVVETTVALSPKVDPGDEFSELVTHEVPVTLTMTELQTIVFASDQNLTLSSKPFEDAAPGSSLELIANEPLLWNKKVQSLNPFLEKDATVLYARNLGGAPANLTMTLRITPKHPECRTIVVVAIGVVAVFLLYFLQRTYAPRMSGIALATFKSEVAQPLFWILIMCGVVALIAFIFVPYFTLGDDIKMLKDTGLTLIMVFGMIQAVYAAGTSVADEIDGKTALTVLSKPVGRRSFLIGKFLGIVWTVLLLFVILGVVMLITVSYKPEYDAKESTEFDLTWQICHLEVVYTVPGLALAFMEAVIMAAISVAISTRLALIPNAVICASIYALGHLPPLIVQSSMGQFVFVQFFGQLIATVFPNLDNFNIQAAIAAGVAVPYSYLGWSLVYCLTYTVIALLLGLTLFEDRDLA